MHLASLTGCKKGSSKTKLALERNGTLEVKLENERDL